MSSNHSLAHKLAQLASHLKLWMLPIQSTFADWQLPHMGGTIVTGSVRSGTSFALRILCSAITVDEVQAGSINEPRLLSKFIVQGDKRRADLALPIALLNRYRLIKSPQVAFLLPYLEPKYRVIATFRDLRLVIPSMLRHHGVRRHDLVHKPYWTNYIDIEVPQDVVLRAVVAAEQYYLNIARYQGSLEVWNYGFWEEWTAQNNEIDHLYINKTDGSGAVLEDVKQGSLFSNKGFTKEIWRKFCDEFEVTADQERAVLTAHERIKQHYSERRLQVKTLDDL